MTQVVAMATRIVDARAEVPREPGEVIEKNGRRHRLVLEVSILQQTMEHHFVWRFA